MAETLVIVESPSKAKTIEKYLGSKYRVIASNGHVRDLPKSQLGVDVEHDFEPKYITLRGRGEVIEKIRKEAKHAKHIVLATDPDREGEAISWHLAKMLKLDENEPCRVVFNEITKTVIQKAVKNPRCIDRNLVDAQQARRVLDRLLGYKISPLLWAKVRRGLSAGRVQSVTTKLICDREREILDFVPKEYWTVTVKLHLAKRTFEAKFYGFDGKKTELQTEADAMRVADLSTGAVYCVADIKAAKKTRHAPAPYTTSSMLQDASNRASMPPKRTMLCAQQLYEGVDIGTKGSVGLITYMRTDSVRISAEAQQSAREYIATAFGAAYVPEKPNVFKGRAGSQDAHEAIRPSDITRTPAKVKDSLSRDQFRLYQLIWNRFTASRMNSAKYETTSVKIGAGTYRFNVSASKVVFDGFMTIYTSDDDEKGKENVLLRSIDKDTPLVWESFDEKQHFTQPPAHYTEASLVKTLEELGIGRPSTYAPTITTILARRYVVKENKNLYVTELGEVVNDMMKEAFPSIVDDHFTANMESLLDSIEDGQVNWKTVVANFYPDLDEAVNQAEKELEKVQIQDEVTDVVCEQCGRNMVVKYGPHGKFLACPGFPDCRNTKPYLEKTGIACPLCGKEVVIKKTKKGRKYYGCENNPECEFMSWQKPAGINCEKCGSFMVEKGNKIVCSNTQCGHVIEKEKK